MFSRVVKTTKELESDIRGIRIRQQRTQKPNSIVNGNKTTVRGKSRLITDGWNFWKRILVNVFFQVSNSRKKFENANEQKNHKI